MKKMFLQFYARADKMSFFATVAGLFSALVITLTFLATAQFLPNQLPLFYSLSWGSSQLASHNQFLILPSLIVLITLLNLVVSWHLHSSQLLLKRSLSLTTLLVALLLLVTALKIIFVFL